MAKKNRPSKQHARPSMKPGSPFEEDNDGNSTAYDIHSVCSTAFSSRDSSNPGEGHSAEKDSEESEGSLNEDYDDFEDKLDALLDGLRLERKGALKTRLGQLMALSKAMGTRFCADYFSERQLTMLDILERSMKRSPEEADCAALAFSFLLITMASEGDFCEDIFPALYEPLLRLLLDHTAKPSARGSCALALSLGVFITDQGTEKAAQVMHHLLAIVCTSVARGSDDATAQYALKATCLAMFSFLASMSGITSGVTSMLLRERMHQLRGCFEAPHLPLRVAAGQCVALLFEQQSYDEEDEKEEEDMLSSLKHEMSHRVAALATDSHKSRSKKELREQRVVFRQVLATVQGEHFEKQTVTIAGQQKFDIDCWQWKHYYDTFCGVLGSGMRLHLSENPFLREVFDLGPVPLKVNELPQKNKASKLEKHLLNCSNRKAREMGRNKVRGKKAELQRWN